MSIPILMYHQIDSTPQRGTPLRGLVVSPGSFARQMRLLRLLGYQGLSMRDLEPYVTGSRQGRVVGITFDDGYENNHTHALPVLVRHGFTATCYGVSQRIADTNRWDTPLGIPAKPLMNAAQWRAWSAAGMDVGSHTCTHANLPQLPDDEARQQITASKAELEQLTGTEVRHFCYPYGKFEPRHARMVQEAGYASATTTERGRVHPGADPFRLKRIMVARATHLALFAAKVCTAYEDRHA